ncbi:MAG: hypothetical protein AAGK02_06370 [Pseudomonadota bacterium]
MRLHLGGTGALGKRSIAASVPTMLRICQPVLLAALLVSCAEPGPTPAPSDIEAAVWKAVEKRSESWVSGDQETFEDTHHPEFARWLARRGKLETKTDLDTLWQRQRNRRSALSQTVTPERVQVLADGRIAIAHYTLLEVSEYTGPDEVRADGEARKNGEVSASQRRYSDIYELLDGEWLFVGGHRDGINLPNRGEIEVPEEFRKP